MLVPSIKPFSDGIVQFHYTWYDFRRACTSLNERDNDLPQLWFSFGLMCQYQPESPIHARTSLLSLLLFWRLKSIAAGFRESPFFPLLTYHVNFFFIFSPSSTTVPYEDSIPFPFSFPFFSLLHMPKLFHSVHPSNNASTNSWIGSEYRWPIFVDIAICICDWIRSELAFFHTYSLEPKNLFWQFESLSYVCNRPVSRKVYFAGDALKKLSAQNITAILTRCSVVRCKNVDKSTSHKALRRWCLRDDRVGNMETTTLIGRVGYVRRRLDTKKDNERSTGISS